MISSTSTYVNANVNPVNADVIKVYLLDKSDDPELVKDWRNWTLQDIVRILKDMAKPEKCYGVTAVEVGNIVFRKLLEAAAANAPFELIEETVHRALEEPAYMRRGNVLSGFKVFGKQAVCDFFKEFVKRGIDDARYYELIYTLLTYRFNDNFPLGFAMSQFNGFNEEVLAKMPLGMQKQLKSYTFQIDDEDMDRRLCYSLLTGESVAM